MKAATSTRRDFLKAAGAATGAAVWPRFSAAGAGERPPNIVYIICDQMRGDALGCLGNPNARTPNLDRLASEGVLFERWFSNNPVCAPSRVTAFTGRYPHEHGKLTNKSGEFPDSIDGTMLGHFRERGYRLGWVGKNHTFEKGVLEGLDFYRGRTREPYRKYTPHVPPWWHGNMYWPEEQCFGHVNTQDALEFLQTTPESQPFFLHVSYFDPHPPYFAPAETTSRFAPGTMRIPPYIAPDRLSPRLDRYARAMRYGAMSDGEIRETMRHYYASIAWGVDGQVGRIMTALNDLGLVNDTIVVFTSDHGDFMGCHRMVRKGMFLYDDLLHVPMIWRAPGRMAAGRRVDALCEGVDLFPTLADMAGGPVPEGLPGRSARRLLEGAREEDSDRIVFASAAYGHVPDSFLNDDTPLGAGGHDDPLHTRVLDEATRTTYRTAMARNRDWKLILNEGDPPELYRMAGGVVEPENVHGARAGRDAQRALEETLRRRWRW